MSSLAFNAAPFDYDNNTDKKTDLHSSNNIEKKRLMKNKTIKRKVNVENMMKQINQYKSMDDDENDISNFNPPPKPLLRSQNSSEMEQYTTPDVSSSTEQTDDVDVENFQNLPSLVADDYYRQYVPYFDRINESGNGGVGKDDLIKKLDYMIHLLEEQQETKTNTVTEEVILYSFLGVFVIFVLDSFARASKYVR
jgi:hypothetical protein